MVLQIAAIGKDGIVLDTPAATELYTERIRG
jgi:hypothetical protein